MGTRQRNRDNIFEVEANLGAQGSEVKGRKGGYIVHPQIGHHAISFCPACTFQVLGFALRLVLSNNELFQTQSIAERRLLMQ